MTIQHTALPWEHWPDSNNGLDFDKHAGVIYGDGWQLALMFADGGLGKDTATANAALIIKAVNNYDRLRALNAELLAALKVLHSALKQKIVGALSSDGQVRNIAWGVSKPAPPSPKPKAISHDRRRS